MTKVETNEKIKDQLISTHEKITLDKVLEYPMTPVPFSLAHTYGHMNKTDKSKLINKLESAVPGTSAPDPVNVIIVDATFFLHTQHLPSTFGEVSKVLL